MFKKIFSQVFTFLDFFKEMALACSIFTLGGWVQLFWTAFDPIFAVVPLKVAFGWHKFDFWVCQKNNHDVTLEDNLPDYFFETQKKKQFFVS